LCMFLYHMDLLASWWSRSKDVTCDTTGGRLSADRQIQRRVGMLDLVRFGSSGAIDHKIRANGRVSGKNRGRARPPVTAGRAGVFRGRSARPFRPARLSGLLGQTSGTAFGRSPAAAAEAKFVHGFQPTVLDADPRRIANPEFARSADQAAAGCLLAAIIGKRPRSS